MKEPAQFWVAGPEPSRPFKSFLEEIEDYIIFDEVKKEKQIVLLRLCLGTEGRRRAESLISADGATFASLKKELSNMFEEKRNRHLDRLKFSRRAQGPSEPFDAFYAELRSMFARCGFPDAVEEALLISQLIVGVHATDLRTALLRLKETVALSEVVTECRTYQVAKAQAAELRNVGPNSSVNYTTSDADITCFRCKGIGHRKANCTVKLPNVRGRGRGRVASVGRGAGRGSAGAAGHQITCFGCGVVGHKKPDCPNSRQPGAHAVSVMPTGPSNVVQRISRVCLMNPPLCVVEPAQVAGVNQTELAYTRVEMMGVGCIPMMVDTGSQLTIVSQADAVRTQLFTHPSFTNDTPRACGFGGTEIDLVGGVDLSLRVGNQSGWSPKLKIWIASSGVSLLGLDALRSSKADVSSLVSNSVSVFADSPGPGVKHSCRCELPDYRRPG